jgi:hypothetical protein
MKYTIIFLCLLLVSYFSIAAIQAQSTIPASGGNATGTGGSVSYSVGQLFYNTNTGTTGTVSQGVQRPYEISVITAVEQAKNINLLCSAYPNPTTDFLTLKVENYDRENLYFWLYDVVGNLLLNNKVVSNETRVTMENLLSGTYILKVTDNGKEVKTFKIIKN